MIPSANEPGMKNPAPLICVIGPTASGKSARAIALAKEHGGEVISVDSRQVYKTLDIGTEKITEAEMDGIPHHLIDIRMPDEVYSAGDFVHDAEQLIEDIRARGKHPILAGGTNFYFDALLYGLPGESKKDVTRRKALEARSTEDLMREISERDPRRASRIDPNNKRRLVRALEIIDEHGLVPERDSLTPRHAVEWIIIDHDREILRERIMTRLVSALSRGLIEEVARTRDAYGDERLKELGLEYRIIGEYLRGERTQDSLLPALHAKLWQYARHQKAWIRKLNGGQN
ncbi:MAG: tRNA dimethylallyltransferase [Parcubacteria bacterium C7867-004]|nr:MAG: tRNA dimethylallyltransferase [Parcubacteria bacterium C7867-004]